MAPYALRCGHPELASLLDHRLSKRLLFNLLHLLDLVGPYHWLDCFVSADFASQLTVWVWILVRYVTLHHVDNRSAMVPSFVVDPLAALLNLDIDIFSSSTNNNFSRFCCDPDSVLSFLSMQGDGFQFLKSAICVRGLCNPVFDRCFVNKFFETVVWRLHQRAEVSAPNSVVLLYIGPPVRRAMVQPSWATWIGSPVCGTFPFHHPVTGILAGFPYPLEMWLLGNLSLHMRANLMSPLASLLRFWKRKHRIHWHADLGSVPCRTPLGWLGMHSIVGTSFHTAVDQYQQLLTQPGHLSPARLHDAHAQVQQLGLSLCHPSMLEAWYRFGVQWSADLCDAATFSVYMVVCLRCSLLYVGSTTKQCWIRFIQEIRAARRLSKFFHPPKYGQARLNHAQHMCRCGLHYSVVGVLRAVPHTVSEGKLRQIEKSYILKVDRNRLLNSVVPFAASPFTCPTSLTVVRQRIVSLLHHHLSSSVAARLKRMTIQQLVATLLESGHVAIDPRELLHLYVLLLQSLATSHPTVRMFKTYLLARLRRIHLYLPASLRLRVLHLCPGQAANLGGVLRSYLRGLTVHPHILLYYRSVLSMIRVSSVSIGQRLFTHRHFADGITFHDLVAADQSVADSCPCHQFATLCSSPHGLHGHVLVRFRDIDTDTLQMGEYTIPLSVLNLLRANMKSVPEVPFTVQWDRLIPELVAWNRKLLGNASGRLSQLLADCRCALSQWSELSSQRETQALAIDQAIRLLRRIFTGLVLGPCDKDPGTLWAACPQLLLKTIYNNFFKAPSLGGFHIVSNIWSTGMAMGAAIRANQLVSVCNKRALAQLEQGCLHRIPSLYVLVKKKTFPIGDTLAIRPITSHASHCLRSYSAKVGRALSALIRFYHARFCGLSRECPAMPGAVKWWISMEQFVKANSQCDLQLFEFDFSNMYYNVNKDQLINLIAKFFTVMTGVFRRRCVAISHLTNKLDRLGSGTGKYYHTLSFQQILQYCNYELYGNHFGRFGLVGFEQLIGVPMGGRCSAQFTSIFFMLLEVEHRLAFRSLQKGFVFWRYRDNLPGVLDLGRCSLDDVELCFSQWYGMPVKLEQNGYHIISLEMDISLLFDDMQGFYLRWYHKPWLFDSVLRIPLLNVNRVPNTWSANRSLFLRIVIPNFLLKCVLYASAPVLALLGIRNLLYGLFVWGFSFPDLRFRALQSVSRHGLPVYVSAYIGRLKP